MPRNVSGRYGLEYWPIERLVPSARNARTHNDAQVAEIAGSIKAFGFSNPILAGEDGDVVAGHGRLQAARKLGLTEVPVIPLKGLSDVQRRQLMLADNRIALSAGWDAEMLALELRDLSDIGVDLGAIGFGPEELAGILDKRPTGLTDPDEAPEPPAKPVAAVGDLWALGRHLLLCGDATSADDTHKVLGEVKPHLMVTDPPYGVEYDADWRNRADRANGKPYGARAVGLVSNDDRVDWKEAWALFPGDVVYCWHAGRHASSVQVSLEEVGFEIRCQVIWAKPRFAISRGHYHWQHEPCWYAVRKGSSGHWSGDRSQTTLWTIPHNKSETGHSTQKPVDCMKRPIENNSSPGQAVYEPFSGSGTTIIAAEMTGRSCHAIEINPAYVDVAIERWQNFTGQKATLDGKTYADVHAERIGG